jgi:hypothetical protein
MVVMVGRGGKGGMPPISVPWLPMATPINTTLSLTVVQAGWVGKLAAAELVAAVELGPMAETALHAAANLAREEIVAAEPEVVMAAMAA